MMDAESLRNFDWIFSTFSGVVEQLIVATSPLMIAIGHATASLFVSGAAIMLIMVMIGVLGQNTMRQGVLSGALVLLAVGWGLQPQKLTLPSGTVVDSVNLTAHGATLAFSIQKIFSTAMQRALDERFSDAGQFLPAQSVTDSAVERTASQFANTDLARLIRDYNAQCNPSPEMFKKAQDAVPIEAYHAVGLMGGGGLGMPDSDIGLMAQLSKAWHIRFTPYQWLDVLDLNTIQRRRAAGIAALKEKNDPFVSQSPYKLPTKGYWLGAYRGEEGTTPDYLSIGDAPGALASAMEKQAQAWKESEGKATAQGFSPSNCYEAYQVAQLGAEQAYNALVETGSKASDGQSANTNSGVVGAARALQRTINRSLNDGKAESSLWSDLVSGSVTGLQLIKSLSSYIDLYTLLPLYVAGCAALLWLVLTTMPIYLMMALIRGITSLTNWLSLLVFPVLLVIMAQLVTVAASISIGSVAVTQAAAVAGWQGASADQDLVRGSLLLVFALILPVSAFMAMKITGVVVGPLGAAAQNAATTIPEAASVVAGIAMRVISRGWSAAMESDNKHPGGPSGGGDGGGGSVADQGTQQKVRTAQEVSSGGGWSSTGNTSARSSIPPLVPGVAANEGRFSTGRTPRSQKRRPKKNDD